MPSRSLRAFLLLGVLVSLALLSHAVPVGANLHSTQKESSIKPGGHGVAMPQPRRTGSTSQVHDTGSVTEVINHPIASQSTHATIPPPQNVVSVPPPAGNDPNAVEGIDFTGAPTSDATGTGGKSNYMETVNHQFAVYNFSGTLEYTATFDSWFQTPQNYPFHDPNVVWDNVGSRFIFIANTGSSLLLAVAQQSDAMGNYCNYKFPTVFGTGSDFDKLGMNDTGVYFSTNILNNQGAVISNELFSANRTQLESCSPTHYTYWSSLTNPDGSIAQAISPAVQDSNDGGTEYLVSSYPQGACTLTLWTLTNGTKLSNTSVDTQCYSPPPPARQKGSQALLNPDDSSLSHASYLNGLLTVVVQGSYDWKDGNGPVGIVEWFVLDASSASVVKQGAFGTAGVWLLYPAAITNKAGNMLFVYEVSGARIYPSIWYVNQTLKGTKALAQGNSYYGTNGEVLWGNYESAWLDHSGKHSNEVWITGQYAKAPNAWGTKFGLVTP